MELDVTEPKIFAQSFMMTINIPAIFIVRNKPSGGLIEETKIFSLFVSKLKCALASSVVQ